MDTILDISLRDSEVGVLVSDWVGGVPAVRVGSVESTGILHQPVNVNVTLLENLARSWKGLASATQGTLASHLCKNLGMTLAQFLRASTQDLGTEISRDSWYESCLALASVLRAAPPPDVRFRHGELA